MQTQLDRVPIDAFGRHRFRATIDKRSVTADDGVLRFKGHAAVFNSRTRIGSPSWGFYEEIAPGSFSKTIGEADVRFLINHDPNLLLARNKAGTLRLAEDEVGLFVDAEMAPTSYAQDLAITLERGDCSQMSFAFDPIIEEYVRLADGEDLYIVKECRLWDVSAVTYPAYEDTDAAMRAAAFEQVCRESGRSPRQVLRDMSPAAIVPGHDGDDIGGDGETFSQCIECEHSNPFGSKFCSDCGQPLGARSAPSPTSDIDRRLMELRMAEYEAQVA